MQPEGDHRLGLRNQGAEGYPSEQLRLHAPYRRERANYFQAHDPDYDPRQVDNERARPQAYNDGRPREGPGKDGKGGGMN
jgi:hypothetical protein